MASRTSSTELPYRCIPSIYPVSEENLRLVEVVVTGSMSAAAIASPILFELRGLWLGVISVFFFSSVIFFLQHGEQIKMYGPFTLVLATFLGFAAYVSARTSLSELVPWVPLTVWLFALLTVYAMPKVHVYWTQRENLQRQMEEGCATRSRSSRLVIPPNQYDFQLETISTRQLREQTVAGMDRQSRAGSSVLSSVGETSIDLVENVPLVQLISRILNLSQQISSTERLLQEVPDGGPSRHLHLQGSEATTQGHPQSPTDPTELNESNTDSQMSAEPLLLG